MEDIKSHPIFKLIDEKHRQVHYLILSKPHLREYIDAEHAIPEVYFGGGEIKLIVIGQDPTIKNKCSRKNITTVLNLNKPGKSQRYIFGLCTDLGINPATELYATYLFKNFFDEPPKHIPEVFNKFFGHWFPVLKEEVSLFPEVPVITLGDHVLEYLTNVNIDKRVLKYWGTADNLNTETDLSYKYISPEENLLGRIIFPFPLQSSSIKKFYNDKYRSYIDFVKNNIGTLK